MQSRVREQELRREGGGVFRNRPTQANAETMMLNDMERDHNDGISASEEFKVGWWTNWIVWLGWLHFLLYHYCGVCRSLML